MLADKKYIRIIETYLIGTLFLYYFGVWNYPHINHWIFICLIISFHVSIYLGYILGNRISINPGVSYSFLGIRSLRYLMIINIPMVLLNAIRMSGLTRFSFFELLTRFFKAFENFSINYKAKFNVTNQNVFLGTTGTVILILWAFIGYAVIPLGFYYYQSLNKVDKSLFFINIFVTSIGAIVTGTNKRVIDIAIIALLSLYINSHSKSDNTEIDYQEQRKKRRRYLFFGIILSISIMSLASQMVGSRGFASYWNAGFYRLGGLISVNPDSIFLKLFPAFLHGFFAILCSYFAQGYFGLSLIIDEGLINLNFGLSSLWIVDTFNTNKLTLQYAAQERYGWDSREMWHSAYSWIANDVGLIGTIFVLLCISCIFCLLIKEYKQERNPICFVLIYYFVIFFIFLPCNLQMFQDAYGFIGFWTFFLLWVFSHIFIRRKI